MCTSRDEVLGVFKWFMAGGGTEHPLVLTEAGDSVKFPAAKATVPS